MLFAAALKSWRWLVLNSLPSSLAGYLNDLAVYDTASEAWSWPHVHGELPSPRMTPGLSILGNDELVVFGGGIKAGVLRTN